MTQTARILRALQNGPVTPIDFAAPDVIDGGSPIMRVAARIQDLRDQGHEITARKCGKVAQYHLDRSTAGERTVASSTAPVARPRPHAASAADRPLPVGGALFDPDAIAA